MLVWPCVVIVSVGVADADPEMTTEGAIEHVGKLVVTIGPKLTTLQLSATAPEKPPADETVTVVLELAPGSMLIIVFVAPLSVNGACPTSPAPVEMLLLYAVSPE